MNLYLAAVYTNNYMVGQQRHPELNETECGVFANVPHILESYHYVEKQQYVDAMRANGAKVFLDSGAFSAKSLGVDINVHDYIDYIHRNRDIVKVEDGVELASVLDGIGDPLKTWQNQVYMEEKGAKPLPCFHFGEDEKYLEWYISKYEYITIGGLVRTKAEDVMWWLDRIWNKYLVDGSGKPRLKVHAFGVTTISLMERYPWHCMTEEDHSVLTKSGWKYLKELVIGEEIFCFNKGESFWSPILELPVFPVEQATISTLVGKNFSATVSGNHRWVTQGVYDTNWRWKTTAQLDSNCLIPRSAKYRAPTNKVFSDEFVELAAWFWTDGSIKKRTHRGYLKDSIVIYQSETANPEKVARIRATLRRSKEAHCESCHIRKRSGGEVEITFELYGSIRDQIREHFDGLKTISYNWLLQLTQEQLDLFIECSVLADGTKSKIAGDGFTLYQKYEENAQRFRVACILAGHPTSAYFPEVGGQAVSNSNKKWIHLSGLTKLEKQYTGNLWCVKVASGAFFTKCKDEVYVTGNSVDSSSWIQATAFGSIYTSKFGPIAISDKSPSRHDWGRHFSTLSEPEKVALNAMLEDKGFCYDRLSTVYQSRAGYNALSYIELGEILNKHFRDANGVLDVAAVQQLF
jgi:hypothetical protein